MRLFRVCFAMAVLFSAFASATSAQSLEDNQLYHKFISNVRSIEGSARQGEKLFPMEFVYCGKAYEKLIASGVSPSARVLKDDNPNLTGTVSELKEKYCVAPEKQVNEDWDAKQAPNKAAVKADKLRLMINENSRVVYRYALAGGKYTDDAKALAAARVWFLDIGAASNERRVCVNGGKLSSVRRYTFDANHKLISTTEKEYCGTPPASAGSPVRTSNPITSSILQPWRSRTPLRSRMWTETAMWIPPMFRSLPNACKEQPGLLAAESRNAYGCVTK